MRDLVVSPKKAEPERPSIGAVQFQWLAYHSTAHHIQKNSLLMPRTPHAFLVITQSLPPIPSNSTHTTTRIMGEANKILRNSVHAFLNGYHLFVSIAALFVLPVSASLLLSQAFLSSSPASLHLISSRVGSLFHAAALPASSSPLFSILTLMLSQTIFSSIVTLPFALTFLLLAKASVVHALGELHHRKSSLPPFSRLLRLYSPLLLTHLFSSFLALSAHASVFSLLFLVFNAAEAMGVSSSGPLLVMSLAGAVLYSILIANTVVVCNLAIVVSAMEKCGGYLPVLRACVLVRGRVATALSIALPTNLALAGVEALFQYRVMRAYRSSSKLSSSIVWESFTIAYMHSVLIVVEIIASCLFYKSCRSSCRESLENEAVGYSVEFEPEDKGGV